MAERLLPDGFQPDGSFPRLARRLRLGIVGGGRISVVQATAARMTDRWEIAAGALSSDPARSRARGKERFLPEHRCHSSFHGMARLESGYPDGVDAVMITTPNNMHFEAARAFLEAGIDVLCDKPLTNDVAEAELLVDLAARGGRVLAVGYVMSCFPMIRQARRMVAEGEIGRINQVHVEFMQDWMIPEDSGDAPHVRWRLDPDVSGPTSCVGDIGSHAAHLASFVSGLAMTDLRAEFHVCGTAKPLEDTVFMFTRYQGEVPGTLLATRLAPGNRGGLRLRVYGSEGGLEWDMEDSERLKFCRYGEADRIISRGHGHGVCAQVEQLVRTARGFPEGIIEAWANLYSEFAMAVAARRDGMELPANWLEYPDARQGAGGVRVIDASVRSHRSDGAWVAI